MPYHSPPWRTQPPAMRVIHGLEDIGTDVCGCILSIGNFDGVHLGHQALLRRGADLAAEASGPLVAMTFDPHPLVTIRPEHIPPTLTPTSEKLARLADAGAEAVIIVRADCGFLSLAADDFVQQVIVGRCRAAGVVEGPSFTYGRGRGGAVAALRAAGARYGFRVDIVGPLEVDVAPGRREVVSSSLIRRAIADGDMALAARALGRPYALIAPVVRGRERGRALGFPTANLAVSGQLLPAEGVYAGTAVVSQGRYPAAISIGRAPTFEGADLLVEAYLIGFDGDVYGRTMRVEIEARLRPQRKFASVDELRAQMARDVAAVRDLSART